MKTAITLAAGILITAIACGMAAPVAQSQAGGEDQSGWDRVAAAQYLDDRINLWFERTKEPGSGEGKTTCISCHMVVPYLLARSELRRAMAVSEPTSQEARLLKEVARRVDSFPDHESLSDSKHKGERGTGAVLNALILAGQDAALKRPRPSEITRKAFRQLWETQRADGAWDWIDVAQEPDESADSQYYGAALAAIAVGTAPGMQYVGEADVAGSVYKLRAYLKRQYATQNLYNRTWMLLASSRLAGLLNQERREELKGELKAKQNGDGGWSLYKLGPWRWSKASPPYAPPGKPDTLLLEKSDGFATGLIAYALRRAGLPTNDPALGRAMAWLKANQNEFRTEQYVWKCWRTYSLNHDRENGGDHGGDWKKMLMSDMATAFAVLALSPSERVVKAP
jgi:squalene-hopene/tetraprenyl-beta-curcumene cyclase